MSNYEGKRRRPEPVRRWSLRAGAGAAAFLVGVLGAALQGQPAGSSSPQGDVYANGQYAMYVETFCKAKAAGNNQRLNEATNALKDVAYYRGVPYVAPVCPSPSPTATSPSPSPSTTSPSPSPSTTSPSPSSSPSPTVSPSPSPTVSPSPTPTPSPTAVVNCMPKPSACGYPDATNTGVPAGHTLTRRNGEILMTGGSLGNVELHGCVRVQGTVDIGFLRVIREPGDGCSYASIDGEWDTPGHGEACAHVHDLEIDMSRLPDTSDWGGRLNQRAITTMSDLRTPGCWLIERVWFHGGSDCAHLGGSDGGSADLGPYITIRDSFCDVAPIPSGYPGDPHIDGFQASGGSGVLIQHNTIRNPNSQTSAIINGTTPGTSAPEYNVRIIDNLMAGGGWTTYCNSHYASISPTIEFRDNRFAKTYFPKYGYYGWSTDCAPVAGYYTNRDDATGAALAIAPISYQGH